MPKLRFAQSGLPKNRISFDIATACLTRASALKAGSFSQQTVS